MLSMHTKEAERRKQELKQRFVSGSNAVRKSAEALSDALLTAINEDVAAAYHAERQIESELRSIQRLLSSNAAQMDQWLTLLDRLVTEFKEMGDVANWLEMLEKAAVEIRDLSKKV